MGAVQPARKYAEDRGLSVLGDEAGARWCSIAGSRSSTASRRTRRRCPQLDWVAKHQTDRGLQDRHGCGWDDDRLAALDLQYHDLRPERSLYARLGMERLVGDAQVAGGVTEPPRDTRAWFRGQCLARGPAVVTANWDSLVFDLGTDPCGASL